MQPTAAACDDLSSATPLLTAADTTTAVESLPFAFDLFGEPATNYWISSNGFLSLQDTTAPPTSAYPTRASAGGPALPNGVVAPYWANLDPRLDSSSYPYTSLSDVRSQVFGTVPDRHLTVQWTEWGISGDTAAHLTFQAKLFEADSAIELHYCTMTTTSSNTAHIDGSYATVEIESLDGTRSFLHQGDPKVDPAAAIRITPVP